MQIRVREISELGHAAEKIISFAEDCRLWLFNGDLGAGKTTLIKELCRIFGVVDMVNSPTFSLVNEYRDKNGSRYYHLDFYRIKNEEEALDIGAEEYLYSGAYCFIEWPSKIPSLLPGDYLSIVIKVEEDGARVLNVVKYD